MERTNHLMLVGEGAERFAVAQGFPRENLLTERSRKIWLLWKETNSIQDDWGPGISAPEWKPPQDVPPGMPPKAEQKQTLFKDPRIQRMYSVAAGLGIPEDERLYAIHRVLFPPTGTIHCSVVNTKGEMSGGTTTSGLAWKLPGRVGDSPIIGAGNYCDQDVGSAGATGSGEENIKIAGAHTIVENMRHGMTPLEAGMDALQRMVRNYRGKEERLRFLDMVFYILRKDGQYAGVALWSNRKPNGSVRQFQVNTDGKPRLENCVALFEGSSIDWPFEPTLPKGS
jgi:N4-(beta-N-acetylglucosaminyl)-L-asparaginase